MSEQMKVAAGAEWLDAHQPGWAERIDVEALRLDRDPFADGVNVLSQLTSTSDGFIAELVELYGRADYALAETHGHDHDPVDAHWVYVDAWIAEVKERAGF